MARQESEKPTDSLGDNAATVTVGGGAQREVMLGRGFAIGRYLVVDHLGSGGMGAVYTAYDPELDRRIALKLLKANVRDGETGSDRKEQLLREAQSLAKLAHPNVVAIHDVGTTDAGVFIAMELVLGRTLRAWLREEGKLGWRRLLEPFLAAGTGLSAAHRAGIVHRDFKPDNVVVGDDGRVRVVDFGLAVGHGTANDDAGSVCGTPPYMAPEQLVGGAVDSRSDQYTFCAVLYEALYGERPFAGRTIEEVQSSMELGLRAEPASAQRVPLRLRKAIRRGLSLDPAARHDSMDALLVALRGNERRTGPVLVWTACVTLLIAGASLIFYERGRQATSELCGGGDQQAAAVWNEAAHQRIHAAFTQSGKPFADDAFQSVARTLDDYVARWRTTRRDACEATRLRGEQSEELLDLRMACLDAAFVQVRDEVDIFASGRASVVERAPAAAHQLPSLAACSDTARLRGEPALPKVKEARATFEKLSSDLAHARTLSYTGDFHGAVEKTEEILNAQSTAKLPRITAAALILRGRIRTNLGMATEAEADLWDASLNALRERDDERAVEAWGLLVFVQGSLLAHYTDADRTAKLASAASERLGAVDALRGALLRNQAAYLVDAGRYDEAAPLLDEALPRMERGLGVEHPNYAATVETLAILQHARGKNVAALRSHERVYALRERVGGPNHPLIAVTLFNLALVKSSLGRHVEALADCTRALQIATATAAPDSPAALNALECISGQQRELDDVVAARAVDEDLLRRAGGAQHGETSEAGYAYQGLAADAVYAGDGKTAVGHAQKAIAIFRATLGADHPSVVETQELLGRGQCLSGRANDAVATLTFAISERERLHLDEPAASASLLRASGDALLRSGDIARGRATLERALALLEPVSDGDPLNLADTRALLGRALALPGGDLPRARALMDAAIADYAQRGRGAERRLREARALRATLDERPVARLTH